MRILHLGVLTALLLGCATVHPEDTEAWVGQPVNVLEKHPLFLTMQVVKTRASDGTEIWNYINGRDVASCSQDGTLFGRRVGWGTYSSFVDCTSRYQACNNIFYIRDGRVQRVVIMSSGGAQCSTDQRFRPTYSG
ncbi:MAG: hypothetical protein JSR91_14415 [Proteobacteria bacterium]|nr:hypothetical protein [Pseudomonadota bacterium]